MARKSITKSKSTSKPKVKKYQFAGSFNPYNQVQNPYYVSSEYAEQAGMEADRLYEQNRQFGIYAGESDRVAAERIKKRQEEEKQYVEETNAQIKAANDQEFQKAAQDALTEGTDIGKKYFKERAALKTSQAATANVANAAMQTGQAGVWAPVASAATPTAASAGMNTGAIATNLASTPVTTAAPTIVQTGALTLPGGLNVPSFAATTTAPISTATTAGTSLIPGAVEVGSNAGQIAAGSSAVAGGTGAAAGGSAAGTGLTSGVGGAAGTGASVGSGLLSAGIGLGLNLGGRAIERSGDDNDFRTFTDKERKRNTLGSAMKSAGTGVGIGSTIGSFIPIPGLGTAAGALIGGAIGAGVGLIKARKENKESERIANQYKMEQDLISRTEAASEAKRKALLKQQGDMMAQQYNTAFLNSRLTGLQTGFGYNTSTNMNMQPTSSFYGKTGGKLPGGHIVPIGDDAVKFIGRKHSEGGIKLDAKTEVEGGETMDKVLMHGGKPNDYFFSAYLKLGGKSFAKRHEELVAAGASQKEIQDLAKKQEAVANKKGEKDRGPEQIAKYGGIHKYQTGNFLVAGPTGKPVYKPIEAMTEEEYNNYINSEGDAGRAVAPNLSWVKDSGEKTTEGNPRATYDFGSKPAQQEVIPRAGRPAYGSYNDNTVKSTATQRAANRRPGPDSTAAEQVDSKGERTPAQSANAQSNKDSKNVTVRDQNKANAKAPSNQQSVASGSKGGTNSAGQNAANTAAATKSKFDQNLFRPAVGSAIASANEWTKFVGLPEGKSALAKDDEGGTSMSMKGVPAGQRAGKKFYGNVTDLQYAAMVSANPWYDFTNFDPSNKDQVLNFQQEYNKRVKAGEKLKEDGKFGQQTVTSRLYKDAPAKADSSGSGGNKIEVVDPSTMGPFYEGDTAKAGDEKSQAVDIRKGINGSVLAGLGQLIPVGYALARPYKAEGNLPRMQGAGNVGSTSVRGALLPRVNMNAERAAAERNTVAIRNSIQNANAGPGGIAAMMAANTAQANQMNTIANQEQEANKQLAAEEARLGMQASMSNAEMAQRANMANVQNQLAVNQANLEAGMQEARMKIDEKRYKREEILGALDTAASRIAGIVKDEKSYKAQERLAKAIDNTGSYDRFSIYEQLQKESQKKGSPYYGKTDKELRKIAADTYNEVAGKMGLEAEEKTGGARRYTSRLGDLNRGRNKRNFNI